MSLKWHHPLTEMSASSLVIGHLNIRSLLAHRDHLGADVILENTDVLCLTETHVSNASEHCISDAHVLRVKSTVHGIAMYVKKGNAILDIDIDTSGIEAMACMIEFPTQSIVVITIYRPPAGSKREFLQSLESMLLSLSNTLQSHQVVVTGDFNLDQLDDSHRDLCQLMGMYGMHQLIKCSTHIRGGILDLMFTNVNDITGDSFPVFYSDHFVVWTSIQKVGD